MAFSIECVLIVEEEITKKGSKMYLNKVTILGRLGDNPDNKTLESGTELTRLSVATTEKWTDKQGSPKESTEWHRIVVFGKTAENCAKYLQKGQLVLIEGNLKTRSWENDKGEKKYTTEVVAKNVIFGPKAHGPQKESVPNHAPTFDTSEEIPF